MNKSILNIKNLNVSLENKLILNNINLNINLNQIIAFVGQSGVGKTTLLKTIAGLIQPSNGEITIDNNIVTKPSNNVGLVFQEYFVFPWLTVEQNISFGLVNSEQTVDIRERKKIVHNLLKATNLLNHINKYPHQLSGGMLQRVAICRALATNPKLLLLDEPFGSLDLITRINLHSLINGIFNNNNNTIFIVTHNIREAVSLANKIYLLANNPATVVKEWIVKKPRSNENFLKLTDEQNSIVEDILNVLKTNEDE